MGKLLGNLSIHKGRGKGTCVSCEKPLLLGEVHTVVSRFFGLSKNGKSRWASAKLHLGCIGVWAGTFEIEDRRHDNTNPTGRAGRPKKALAALPEELRLERRQLSKRYNYLLRHWLSLDSKGAPDVLKQKVQQEVEAIYKRITKGIRVPMTPHKTKLTNEELARLKRGFA